MALLTAYSQHIHEQFVSFLALDKLRRCTQFIVCVSEFERGLFLYDEQFLPSEMSGSRSADGLGMRKEYFGVCMMFVLFCSFHVRV